VRKEEGKEENSQSPGRGGEGGKRQGKEKEAFMDGMRFVVTERDRTQSP